MKTLDIMKFEYTCVTIRQVFNELKWFCMWGHKWPKSQVNVPVSRLFLNKKVKKKSGFNKKNYKTGYDYYFDSQWVNILIHFGIGFALYN